MIHEKVVTQNKEFQEECLDSHSTYVDSDIKLHINKYAQHISGSVEDELSEKTLANDCSIKILKAEAEILYDSENCTVSENDRESQERSFPFHLGSGTRNYTIPAVYNEGAYNIELVQTSPVVEPQILLTATLVSDSQKPLSSANLIKSNENVEHDYFPQIISCKEHATAITSASASGLSLNISPKMMSCKASKETCGVVHEGASSFAIVASNDCTSHDPSCDVEKTRKKYFNRKETDEFPSFDLWIMNKNP